MPNILTPDQFLQVKHLMRAIWTKYPDEFGYRSEKIAEVDAATSIESGYRLVQMLDYKNQAILAELMAVLSIPIPDDWADIIF